MNRNKNLQRNVSVMFQIHHQPFTGKNRVLSSTLCVMMVRMAPNVIIPAAIRVIIIKLTPVFRKKDPSVAPTELAKLKTDAAIVPDNVGASVPARIIFELRSVLCRTSLHQTKNT